MNRQIATLAAAITLCLAGCAVGESQTPAPSGSSSAAQGGIWFASLRNSHTSWGIERAWWTLNADGSGEYATGKQPPRSFQDFDFEIRSFQLTPDQTARVAALVRAMQSDGFECKMYVTDMPTAVLRWTADAGNGELSTYSGCTEESGRVRYPAIEELEGIISAAAKDRPIIRTVPNKPAS
ncbi:hypothetical protein GRI97_12150 [Altererythrobacter xixiisoli]|uniref:Toxin co-regulated pilus biosynthesis protein Q C-terminal domain-containing protein n=1 Tax=Croceibacterium xixiisoli TaxID=1476466 RepID=A0A6I4TWY1_9SPHN|nr:hypothetical protein [Croceibacterium xixiisoli]MXO99740.1 hypothetical protein [Croceibacterium xixiisoli]